MIQREAQVEGRLELIMGGQSQENKQHDSTDKKGVGGSVGWEKEH